ncbi:phosphatidylserine decarboxylase [Campylobacter sp. MIT 21-1685]|uniref:phosphatidylserine decarboxylase n=1 Tax=unclassified Campylobacter TaxID=2593542 RepID=UPI00224A67BC|nr:MULTISPECIES: phosphatidylserine decarboxylase [unclassified Campylobacter]MCX2683217.1 phosphatidylserine decarboxylase [Campylobacter sp. MIT 21-1684]MCX2751463.1 phosphatidylserine decarboxylase [Campylobacter sp. MIT 21-1682]MCX2807698.1 phosphatidylserine decarboxylase [Campylobacter sp. MIT 21-1685]
MKRYIAKEGYNSIIIALAVFLLFWIFYSFSFFLFFIVLFLLFLFRKPQFSFSHFDKKALIAPVSGKIVKLENVFHKELGDCIELQIKNAFYDVGILNAPCEMEITQLDFKHGLFLCYRLPQFLNERLSIVATTNEQKIVLCIYGGSMQRKIHFNANSKLAIGDIIGFSLNSSLSIFLPRNTRLLVNGGDQLKYGTLLGYLS